MEVVESQSLLRRVITFLQEPFQKMKERWLAYFAELGIEDPSAVDLESESHSSHDMLGFGERHGTRASRKRAKDRHSSHPINRLTFVTAILGTTIGLGQLWRFPNVAYKMGGGAFLFIYLILTLLFGYSLHFMELASGQFTSLNAVRFFDKVPLMQGVGYAMIAYAYIHSIYSNQMVGFGLHYLAASFDFDLPWAVCPSQESTINSTRCLTLTEGLKPYEREVKCPKGNIVLDTDKLCTDSQYAKMMETKCCKTVSSTCPPYTEDDLCRKRELPPVHYWTTTIEKPYPPNNPQAGYLGEANLKLLLCSFVAWFIVFMLVSIGLKWSGIFALIIIPLMAVSLMLTVPVVVNTEGAWHGVQRFFIPELKSFIAGEIWLAALEQSLYSLGIGMGLVITMGSLSHFKSPCHVDPMIVSLGVVLTSILSATVVFSSLGHLAKISEMSFDEAVASGPGVSIIAYSAMVAQLPISWLCSVIFFFLFVAISAISVGGIITSISITLSDLLKVSHKDKYILNFLLVFTCFLFGIPIIMRGGVSVFAALDIIPGGIALPQICLFEFIALVLYGIDVYCEDVAFMMGFYPNRFFRYSWMLYPVFLIPSSIYAYACIQIPEMRTWLAAASWTLYALILSPIFVFMGMNVTRNALKKNWGGVLRPDSGREPRSQDLKHQRQEFQTDRSIF